MGFMEFKYIAEVTSLAINSNCDVCFLTDLFAAIKSYVQEKSSSFNRCYVISINDFSKDDHNRIDIELHFELFDSNTNTCKSQLWQKVFYVDGNIFNCTEYAHRFL